MNLDERESIEIEQQQPTDTSSDAYVDENDVGEKHSTITNSNSNHEEKPASAKTSFTGGQQEQQQQQQPHHMAASESLADNAQSLIDEMGEKRKQDEALVTEFRNEMTLSAENSVNILESYLSDLYEKNNGSCQEKMQELYTILGRISVLEQELDTFKHSFKMFYSDINC